VPFEPSPPIRPIHAGAVVDAVGGILERGSGKGAAYNLTQGEAWSHGELVAAIAGRLGVRAEVIRRPRTELVDGGVFPACAPLAHPWMSVLDPGRARRELGFRPGRFEDWLPVTVDRLAERPAPAGYEGVRARELALAS
jgi:nucleoside-diphosphate-sugar epimerase